ncbi:GrpB family protein [Pedobacter cryoconitis]|uniref:GrpB-like predicted nucleotidyltransferase (UPF0157 family) n=1 Tax=Pedobacter cryoconitis TaxID=188932 RepID=A0A7X0J2Y5_9SPHI|nr:GrpB family protein [Pedobacter cryoconitis]MBB6498822.1 GrpB-like predicted nucleotidyltransferase (UPF0157 family) [Pedobacter cryoconitis]
MIITIQQYDPTWKRDFSEIEAELVSAIGFLNPEIEHIGSTSVQGLSAKPIIDILVGVQHEDDLDKVPPLLMDKDYVYYENYNEQMPYRRFFVKLKSSPQSLSLPLHIRSAAAITEQLHRQDLRLAHIHVLPLDSVHWTRHIAFRDYLRTHPEIKEEYQQLKERLSLQEWKDGIEYNDAKDSFLKREEQKAVNWYLSYISQL